jgi:hypothetical protein
MKRKSLRFLIYVLSLAAVLLLGTVAVYGQSVMATLGGSVTDQSGAVVPDVKITILNAATSLKRTTVTSAHGYFSVALLPPGTYSLAALRDGFAPVEIRDIVLNTNDLRDIAIVLKVGTKTESVTVEADVSTMDTTHSVATVVDRTFVENMPLNGRSFMSLIELTPGVVRTAGAGQFSFNGSRDNTNYFTVDGISANVGIGAVQGAGLGQQGAGEVGNLTAIGTTSSILSVDAMQEFKIQTSTYSAEFGRSAGGQIQMVSRSGTNSLRGTAFDYVRNEIFDAMNPFNKWQNWAQNQHFVKPPLRQNDFGFVLGGPVYIPGLYDGKDKTFFFVSYEGIRLRLPTSGVFAVPPAAIRTKPWVSGDLTTAYTALQPYMAMVPLPNSVNQYGQQAFSAVFSNPKRTDATSIKIDHTINSKLILFGRFSDSPSYSAARYPSSANEVDYTHFYNKTLTLGATSALSNRLANELRFNWSKVSGWSQSIVDDFGGATLPTQAMINQMFPKSYGATPDNSMFVFGLYPSSYNESWQYGTAVANTQRQLNATDNLTYMIGKHSLKFGTDFRYLYPIAAPYKLETLIAYYADANINSGIATMGLTTTNDEVVVHLKNLSFYAQDSWKISPRLTLDYGLRWDLNPPPHAVGGQSLFAVQQVTNPATATLGPAGTPLYPTIKNAFAPRLGASYQLLGRPGWETVLRGGWGLFYDTGVGSALNATAYYPHSRTTVFGSGASWLDAPLPLPPGVNMQPPYTNQNIFGYEGAFALPRTYQWNFQIEQTVFKQQTVTLAYVGSAGRDLMRFSSYPGTYFGNRYLNLYVLSNVDSSDYNAMQVKYMRRMSHGFQAMANYTWSKSLDTSSQDDLISTQIALTVRPGERGYSNFDIRHSFTSSLSYDIPSPSKIPAVHAILGGWSMDGIYKAHTAYPLNVTFSYNALSLATQQGASYRPDLVPGVPIWIDNPAVFGGKMLNWQAFDGSFTVNGSGRTQGNLARGSIRGLPIQQMDFALRRQIKLTERVNLQIRVDAFNLFNVTNYTNPNVTLGTFSTTTDLVHYPKGYRFSSAPGVGLAMSTTSFGVLPNILGGTSLGGGTYGIGGPRSMQFALKLQF